MPPQLKSAGLCCCSAHAEQSLCMLLAGWGWEEVKFQIKKDFFYKAHVEVFSDLAGLI